ncbi:hypothetical protein C8Q75DRAFT_2964 [Abortiporus biennis]|nr:hypothetical protein C8Q75DRAFT_2964 [Abortiporus biennis]
MLSIACVFVLSLHLSLAVASPTLTSRDDPTESSSPIDVIPEEQVPADTHSNTTWEVILAVVFSIVVTALIAIAVYVKLRQRRRRRERAFQSVRSSADLSPYGRRTGRGSPTQLTSSKLSDDQISQPIPALTYEKMRGSPSSKR